MGSDRVISSRRTLLLFETVVGWPCCQFSLLCGDTVWHLFARYCWFSANTETSTCGAESCWEASPNCLQYYVWKFVCCCLVAKNVFIAERWLLPRQLGAVGVCISRRVLSGLSCCCRYYVSLTLLFVSANSNLRCHVD